MKLYPLLILSVSGLTSGQRDLVVNRRARQNIPSRQQSDRYESAESSPAPSDPFSSYRTSVEPVERRRVRARTSSNTNSDAYNNAALPYTDTAAQQYNDAASVPYHELGGSARQRIQSISAADDSLAYSGLRSSEQTSLSAAESAVGVPYFERGGSERQHISDEQYYQSIQERTNLNKINTDLASAVDTVRNFIDAASSENNDDKNTVTNSFRNYNDRQSIDRGDSRERYDASDRRDIIVSPPAPTRSRTRLRDSNLIRRRIDTTDVAQSPAQYVEKEPEPRPTVPRRTLTRTRSRSDYVDRSIDRGYTSSYNEIPDTTEKPRYTATTRDRTGRLTSRARTRSRVRSGTQQLSDARNSQEITEAAPAPVSSRTSASRYVNRSRGGSRFTTSRSKPDLDTTTRYSVQRPNLRFKPRPESPRPDTSRNVPRNNRRIDIEQNSINDSPDYSQASKIKFPKKNLIPGLPRITFVDPKEKKESYVKPNRYRTDIKPSKPRTTPAPREELGPPEIQSSQNKRDDIIIVTHKVPTKTIFTVVEDWETKSLFIDTYTNSLQDVTIRDLKSTYIDDSPIIYANFATQDGFGVKETLFDGIHPTRTVIDVHTGRNDDLSTEYSTIYNVITATVRNIEEIEAEPVTLNSGLAPDLTQIGSLLQTVILGLLGGGLGGNILGNGIQQKVPQTNVITHTRSFVTTTTTIDTILVPVTFRGNEIFQTVSDTRTKVFTATDYSTQTIVQPGIATSTPFLPLAPTLHRATRVVPTYNPLLPALLGAGGLGANQLGVIQPTPQLTLITHTSTMVTTMATEITKDIVITLGGREVQTQVIRPTQAVVTLTSESTQTVTVSPGQLKAPIPAVQAANTLNQLSVLRAILQLQG